MIKSSCDIAGGNKSAVAENDLVFFIFSLKIGLDLQFINRKKNAFCCCSRWLCFPLR